jgi:NAD(P)-dependent dehydrogenase (short-subunit alcohol dehydrogenase family)
VRLAEFHAIDDLRAGRLVPLFPDHQALDDDPIYAVYEGRRHLSHRIRAFIEFRDETFPGHPPSWQGAALDAGIRHRTRWKMSARLKDRIVCITGAASGIGRSTALLMAREGALVVATDFQAETGEALAEEIVRRGGQAIFLPHDVTDEEAWHETIAAIGKRCGRLDVLVNNAGIGLSGPVVEMSLADWRRQTAVNLDGVFLGVKHGLPLLRRSGGGSIVNVSSIAGIKASANAAGYCATKAAVRQFTKAVALECAAAKDNVRVNSIHPGIVETAIWDSLIGTRADGTRGPALAALTAASIPLGRTGTVEEIAAGILWLASDESRYVTGTELVIDGGRSIA